MRPSLSAAERSVHQDQDVYTVDTIVSLYTDLEIPSLFVCMGNPAGGFEREVVTMPRIFLRLLSYIIAVSCRLKNLKGRLMKHRFTISRMCPKFCRAVTPRLLRPVLNVVQSYFNVHVRRVNFH